MVVLVEEIQVMAHVRMVDQVGVVELISLDLMELVRVLEQM